MEKMIQSYEILTPISEGAQEELKFIESVARTCYKSEPKFDDDQATMRFVDGLVRRGHLAMLEHSNLSVKFTVDRCVSHEMVRHRLASFAQESTRWCNYAKDKFGAEIKIISPDFSMATDPEEARIRFETACLFAEKTYINLIDELKVPAQIARRVLPHALKTEVVITANYREWMHILELRSAPDCDPEMQEIMTELLAELQKRIPIIFDRVGEKRHG